MAATKEIDGAAGYAGTPGLGVGSICLIIILIFFTSCHQDRVFEEVEDFPSKTWVVNNRPQFSFVIQDHTAYYNLYYTLRNSLDFPFSRVFVHYDLHDSTGTSLRKKLTYHYLFDQKTGWPTGNSGLGDLYDHRFTLAENYKFEKPGLYTITLEQFNRRDTLAGIVAVGVLIEKATTDQ